MKLKTVNLLDGRYRCPVQVILLSSFQSKEPRCIRAKREVHSNRPNRCTIANSHPSRLHQVIEILQISLPESKAEITKPAINVPRIVENHTVQIIAIQRKAKLRVVNKKRITSQRKPGCQIARSSLEIRECANGGRSSRIEPFGQRNCRPAAVRLMTPNCVLRARTRSR